MAEAYMVNNSPKNIIIGELFGKLRFADIGHLTRVVDFKNRFYQCPAQIYASAKSGSMKLLPHPDHIAELQRDYRLTTTMMYGDIPSFDAIIEFLGRTEQFGLS